MKNLFNSIRTLCLVAVMCMVSANALAYDICDGGDIFVDSESCKILVVEEDATVDNCAVLAGGVLIIGKNATLTVEENFSCSESILYVYGTLNLNLEETVHSNFYRSTVYVMQGGSLVGSYNEIGDNTISTNVAHAAVGSFVGKVDALVPTPANSFFGWPDYYQRRIYSTDGEDSYPVNYEDAACTQPIADLNAWKIKYSNMYHAAYDAGVDATLGSMGTECDDCPAVEISDDNTTIKLYNPKKVEFTRWRNKE